MKKRLLTVGLIAVIVLSLAGCGKKVCESCGEEYHGSKTVTMFGEEINVCDECYERLMDELF